MAFAFLGGIMVTSGVTIAIPGILPEDSMSDDITLTGTPADNYPDEERPRFCGSGNAKSGTYVKEYQIPTECTQPLAISLDSQGNVWFAQTNTGKIAKFSPSTETFTEFENPFWPPGGRSMMWGMDYSPDGSIWYTDEQFDSLWKFSILNEEYQRFAYPAGEQSLPQKLKIEGSQIIVNDLLGNKITFLDPLQTSEEIEYLSLPSPVEQSVTGDFTIDSENNVWYTNWIFQQDGRLVKFDHDRYQADAAIMGEESLPIFDYMNLFPLPLDLSTPNGAAIGPNGKIWLADTSSSFFFSFDPLTESFTKYLTSPPPLSTYGNASGVIKSPVTRPYWIETSDSGELVFNQQTGNRIAVFDSIDESLVEYLIPSKNPNWADCSIDLDCGLAQVFGFSVSGDKVWFTEWVENNIGVLDTSIALPYDVQIVPREITLKKGEQKEITLQIIPSSQREIQKLSLVNGNPTQFSDLVISPEINEFNLNLDAPQTIKILLTTSDNALATSHKVLIGAQNDEISISKFITVNIIS